LQQLGHRVKGLAWLRFNNSRAKRAGSGEPARFSS
jgi:hypothetical protein